MYNAFFCRDSYFLLPEPHCDWESFRTYLHTCGYPVTLPLTPLLENNRIRHGAELRGECMAPCFLTDGRNDPVPFTIRTPDEVYPVQVERMTTAEYNARLREVVRAYCPGCGGYSPIDDSDDSLQGHHREISLNSVCFYRWEGKDAPLCLKAELDELTEAFIKYSLGRQSISIIRSALRSTMQGAVSLTRRMYAADGVIRLLVSCGEGDILAPVVLAAADHFVCRATDDTVLFMSHVSGELSGETLAALLAPENRETVRASCRKHGCAIAEILWDTVTDGQVEASISRLEAKGLVYILDCEPGRCSLLLLDVPAALKGLRYRTPLLQAHGARLAVHDGNGSREYTIDFDMPCHPIG